jgi:hypothetical protein
LADQNQQNQGQQRAGQQQGGQQGQTLEQQRAQAQQQGGRLQADQQPPQGASAQPQPRGGQQQGGGQQDSFQRGAQQGQEVARQRFEEEKRLTAERPQQVGDEGQQPTPTQQENDEIRNGLRHIDDKENDRSGADFVHNRVVRRVDAEESKGKYETR